jgi:N-acetylneuraminic acid mutarotase
MIEGIILNYVLSSTLLLYFGNFLDRYDMATLETLSRGMQENARKIIKVRNQFLPVGKRMANLEGAFSVSVVLKKLLQREGLYPLDIIATGGYDMNYLDGKIVNTVMSLDLLTKQHRTLAPMITACHSHASAMLDGKLFVLGGYNNGTLSRVECLNMETEQWSEMPSMIVPRGEHGASVLGGKIYVAGGRTPDHDVWIDECLVLALVESFDPATNQWTAVTPMNTHRRDHGLVSVQGKLFAVGGCNFMDKDLDSVERFDPSTRVWSNITSLSTARHSLAVAVLGDKLYAIGGKGSQNQLLSSVECLDLTDTNSQWTIVAPMTTPRCGMGAMVTDGKIYIAGGYTPSLGWTRIECFDPSDGHLGRWTVISETLELKNRATILSF